MEEAKIRKELALLALWREAGEAAQAALAKMEEAEDATNLFRLSDETHVVVAMVRADEAMDRAVEALKYSVYTIRSAEGQLAELLPAEPEPVLCSACGAALAEDGVLIGSLILCQTCYESPARGREG